MRRIVISVFVFLMTLSVYGQQDPQYTHYMYNMNVVNPAYAGSHDSAHLNFLARTQWVGLDGAPETITFGVHSPVGKRVGLGLTAIADKLGPLREQNIYGDFSYTLPVGNMHKLAFGLKAGVTMIHADFPNLVLTNQGDRAFENKLNRMLPNFGLGAYYYSEDFYVSLSMPNVLETLWFEKDQGRITKASERTHLFLSGGYVFDVSKSLKLKPSALVKAVTGAPLSIDLSLNALFSEKFELGVSYRLDDSVSGLINFRASPSMRIGYSYDHTVSNLGNYNSGTHEVILLFNFDFSRNQLKSPRFF